MCLLGECAFCLLEFFFQLDNAASTARPWSVITMREPLRSINPFDDEPRARGGRVAGDFGGAGAGGRGPNRKMRSESY
jgi:hypothetical protein